MCVCAHFDIDNGITVYNARVSVSIMFVSLLSYYNDINKIETEKIENERNIESIDSHSEFRVQMFMFHAKKKTDFFVVVVVFRKMCVCVCV